MGRTKRQTAKTAFAQATSSDVETDQPPSWATVGADLVVRTNYFDMRDAPDDGGLTNCGYLVLRKGELVRIYYVGSSKTRDAGWLYGEVLKSAKPEAVGKRGWLPAAPVTPPVKSASSSLGPMAAPPGPSKSDGLKEAMDVKTEQAANKQWQSPSPKEIGRSQQESTPISAAAAAVIQRNRDLAAKAAAAAAAAAAANATKPGGRSGDDNQCPVCMEAYTKSCYRVHRSCCKGELCAQCDHKGLLSGRCYFCREGEDEFPEVHRVAAARLAAR